MKDEVDQMLTVRRSGKEACGSCSCVIKLQLLFRRAAEPLRAGSTSPGSGELSACLQLVSQVKWKMK